VGRQAGALRAGKHYPRLELVPPLGQRERGGSIGDSKRSDTIYTTTVGFLLNVPVSLQRFQLEYRWYDARYQHFDDLDHNGHIVSPPVELGRSRPSLHGRRELQTS
jgi:hypothetical protein